MEKINCNNELLKENNSKLKKRYLSMSKIYSKFPIELPQDILKKVWNEIIIRYKSDINNRNFSYQYTEVEYIIFCLLFEILNILRLNNKQKIMVRNIGIFSLFEKDILKKDNEVYKTIEDVKFLKLNINGAVKKEIERHVNRNNSEYIKLKNSYKKPIVKPREKFGDDGLYGVGREFLNFEF